MPTKVIRGYSEDGSVQDSDLVKYEEAVRAARLKARESFITGLIIGAAVASVVWIFLNLN